MISFSGDSVYFRVGSIRKVLHYPPDCVTISERSVQKLKVVGIAQLVRALDCGSRGRGFESHYPPHNTKNRAIATVFI